MKDLIERQAAIDALSNMMDIDGFRDGYAVSRANVNSMLKRLPPAQPERKRGQWNITDAYPHNVYCSECYTRFAQTHWTVWEDGSLPRNFCPHCGAEMSKE